MMDSWRRLAVELAIAALYEEEAECTQMDWRQVALNGGPPCFFDNGNGQYCGRAERWAGHGSIHPFIGQLPKES